MKEKNFESLFIDVYYSKTEILTVGTIYMSPCNSKQSHTEFLDTISPLLHTITTSKTLLTIYMSPLQKPYTCLLVILSNPTQSFLTLFHHYYIPSPLQKQIVLLWETYANTFIDTMYDNSYYSLRTKLTRITATSATLIDHFWTNIFNLQTDLGIFTDCIADHLPLILGVQINSPHVNKSPTDQRCFRNSNIAKFMATLENYNTKSVFSCSDVNYAFDQFIHNSSSVFHKSFPLKHFSKFKKKETKWYDTEFKNMYRKKQLQHKKFQPTENNHRNYCKICMYD